MGEVIAVCSGKGGTGKTSFCANVAVCLCALGEHVLLIDADAGLRNLDLVLGMSDSLLFSYIDVLGGTVSLKEASVIHPIVKNLRVLTAPASSSAAFLPDFGSLATRAREHFTYTLIDCSAGLGRDVLSFGTAADRAVIVSTPDATSLRNAQATAIALAENGQSNCRLAVNRVRKALINRGDAYNIDRAMDASGLGLLGVIPEDEQVIACSNRGQVLLLSSLSPAVGAYMNIARRIKGIRVPLLEGVKGF